MGETVKKEQAAVQRASRHYAFAKDTPENKTQSAPSNQTPPIGKTDQSAPQRPKLDDASREKLYQALKDKRNFDHMPEPMLRKLIDAVSIIRFPKGKVILQEGRPTESLFILIKGFVAVHIGQKLLYRLGRTGDVFGEISFIENTDCSASIWADEDVTLVAISHQLLGEIGDNHFYKWLCHILANKLTRTSQLKSK